MKYTSTTLAALPGGPLMLLEPAKSIKHFLQQTVIFHKYTRKGYS